MAPAQRSALQTDLIKRLQNREATVCVVGLGYVGLPVAVAIGQAGHQVIGVDMAETRVEQINSGLSYIDDVQTAAVGQLVRSGHLTASVGFEAADVAVIAVPTPLDAGRTPDLTFVRQAARGLAEVMRAGSLVVLESTTYPGTTEEIVVPEFTRKGFTPGQDLFVAYSPERIDPGNKRWTLRNTPKVIGGLNSESLEAAVEFYGGFVDTLVPAPDLKTAEMTKLFENTFRLINIGLVNEFTTICESFGVDIWTVIDACTSKPFGFMPFYPGPGAGGHCIPIDPAYLAWKAREREVSTDFIDLASRINHNMPGRVLERVTHQLNETRLALNSARVGVLGVAYKKNSSDVRESPAIRLLELLHDAGARVSYHDPHVPALRLDVHELRSQPLTADYLDGLDCVVVVADHDAIDWSLVQHHAQAVVDTRGVFNVPGRPGDSGLAK
jgi:nucleotide sugar dehydrogenase